jgi:prepilin-type processing-associated H-X9-DG protein
MRKLRPRLTYANACATIALFLALGGGAVAATRLPAGSVGTAQLRKGAVSGPKLKADAVTGAKVADGSLTGADIQASTLGTVPSAESAGRAQTADRATSAESAARAVSSAHAESADSAGHATSADTAGHAESADTATRATSAGSADEAADAMALQGHPASDFLPAGRVLGVPRRSVGENEAVELFSVGTITVAGACPAGSGFDQATLLLEAHGAVVWDGVTSLGAHGGELTSGASAEVGRSPVGSGGTTHAGGTVNILTADGHALHISFEQVGSNTQAGGCIFSASAISE